MGSLSEFYHPPRVGMVSLGCPKALVDSERILTGLRARGYEIVGDYKNADLVIINTCGFITEAVQESLEAIEEALHENGRVIVTGCLGAKKQENGENLIYKKYPKVLAVTPPHATEEVLACVEKNLPKPHHPFLDLTPDVGVKLTPKHYAYIKISEGCNNKCSFCIIPSMRGKLVSRPISDVIKEAKALVNFGVKELLIISQDTSAYGVDCSYKIDFIDGSPVKTRILDLAQELGKLGVWVRLHYVYPYPHVDEVLNVMASGKILPYLDVPFQHADPRILKLMRRPASGEKNLERIQTWRKICPEIVIRSTFVVGFPGETEAEFENLLDFLRAAEIDRVGCFPYSSVEGAAANNLPNPIPDSVAKERVYRLMNLQEEISRIKLSRRVGAVEQVLIDEVQYNSNTKNWRLVTRSKSEAPNIDGVIYVDIASEAIAKKCLPGSYQNVRLIDYSEHDLYAVLE